MTGDADLVLDTLLSDAEPDRIGTGPDPHGPRPGPDRDRPHHRLI
jgi:hypothetical protein